MQDGSTGNGDGTLPSDQPDRMCSHQNGTHWWLVVAFSLVASSFWVRPAAAFDDEKFFDMATMQAALVYAADKCPGRLDPNAEAAVAVVAGEDPEKMKRMVIAMLVKINLQGQKIGVAAQCRAIVDAYGPDGAIKAGAWKPSRR
jgi:cytosine/adenosine deaminase-related metal-dependent hydrolase